MTEQAIDNPLRQALASLKPLTAVLAEHYAGLAIVRADGTWHLEQNGAVRRQSGALPRQASQHLIDTVHRQGPRRCLDHWWVRPMTAGPEGVVVFVRRPAAFPDGLSQHTLKLLNNQLPHGANGLIFGATQLARSSLLLSMTRFLPRDLVVYIGPVPPIVADDVSLLHILPPRHDRDRRELAVLLEHASAVLFDGPVHRADLRLLFSGRSNQHRWLAADAQSVDHWRHTFDIPPVLQAALTTHIGLRSSPSQNMRIDHFAVADKGQWKTLLERTKTEAPPTGVAEATVAENPRISAQLTSPVHGKPRGQRRATADNRPDNSPDNTTSDNGPSPKTFEVKDLLDDAPEAPELLRESGEIEVPGFRSRRQDALRQLSEQSDAASADSSPTDAIRGERVDRELAELVASEDIDDVEIPDLDPEQLRQTFSAEVDVEALRAERERSRSQKSSPASPTAVSPADGNDLRATSPDLPSQPRKAQSNRASPQDSRPPSDEETTEFSQFRRHHDGDDPPTTELLSDDDGDDAPS